MSRFRNFIGKPGRAVATATLAVSLAASPLMVERIAKACDKGAEVQKKPDLLSSEKLKEKLAGVKGSTDKEKAESLFKLLKAGSGVLKLDPSNADKRAPRNVDETLEKGGDCTEFALVVLAALKQLGIEGGALVVHFEKSPETKEHMFAYAKSGDEKIIIDPQAAGAGKMMKSEKYAVKMDLTPKQATGMYYRETGEHLMKKGKTDDAIKSFEQALEINPQDAYCHHMLGILYEKKGEKKKADEHHAKAAELDPENSVYKKNVKVVDINKELQLAQEAINKEDWDACIKHYENVLNSGVELPKKQKDPIENNLKACRQMKGE